MRSLVFLLLLFLSMVAAIDGNPPDPPPKASTSSGYAPSVVLSAAERFAAFQAAFEEASLESGILDDEEKEEQQGWSALGLDLLEKEETEEEEEDFEEGDFAGVDAAPPVEQPEPDTLESPSDDLTTEYPILQDPRAAIDIELKKQFPSKHAAQLSTALTRIRNREGWPDARQIEQITARIEAWQDVMLNELEAAGTLPVFARIFTQPASRYLAPVLSQYAWPPLYALERNGEYVTEFAFGDGSTLSESIVDRMGELRSESIIGNLDVSYLAFPGDCVGEHPLSRYLSEKQRSVINRFHSRVYREILRFPRVIIMNGGDVERDLVLPLVDAGIFESETVNLPCRFSNVESSFEYQFIRPVGAPREHSSFLIRRRHPQALSGKAKPSLFVQLQHDVSSELIRALAHQGGRLPRHTGFLASFGQPSSTWVEGDYNERLEPARIPIEHRLSHLARVERTRTQPWTIDQLRFIDFEVARWIQHILKRLPERTTEHVLCNELVMGSPLQDARNRLLALASETRHRTYSIRGKVRWKVTLTAEEKKHLDKADDRKKKKVIQAERFPEREARWKIARRDQKRNRTEQERLRASRQDQASYRRRLEEMTPEERAGRLEQQSERSNVRNLVVVDPLDFLASLNGPPQLSGPSIPASPDLRVPALASTKNSLPAPLFPIFNSAPGIGLPHPSNDNTSNTPPTFKRPLSKELSSKTSKTSKKKKSSEKKRKSDEEEEEEVITTAAPQPTRPSGNGKGKGVDRSADYDSSMRKKGW